MNKMKASLDEDQTDIVQFMERESRSVENIADVSATQNAISLIFQCHDHATIFISDTIAETRLKVVPSGHHLKSDTQRLRKNLRRWDWPAFLETVQTQRLRRNLSGGALNERSQNAAPLRRRP